METENNNTGYLEEESLKDVWLRREGPRLGVDAQKFILGNVLSDITGDDGNYFYWYDRIAYKGNKELLKEIAFNSQEEYKSRLKREASCFELPQEIRDKLQEILNTISSSDWRNREDFSKAHEEWKSLSSQAKERIKEYPEFDQAIEYYMQNSLKVSELYQQKQKIACDII